MILSDFTSRSQSRLWFAIAMLVLVRASFAEPVQESRTPPNLILVLAIDQMRFDYLTRFDDLYEGGLRKLIDEGAVFTNARYRHAGTWTGPGHSVILSGRHPSNSGIIFNEWYDTLLERGVTVVEDPFHSPLGGSGAGASPVNFVGFTVGDALKRADPRSKIVGVSVKDDSAVLMAGRFGDAAYWYEVAEGNFITSTYYMDESPGWLERWNSKRMADRYAGVQWTRLMEDSSIYEEYAGEDAIEGEWDGINTIFPHGILGNPPEADFYYDLSWTPFADEITLDVSLEAVTAHDLGTDASTDILAIGFSGTDRVGHRYGAKSQELMDQLLRLDLLLARLFDQVDERVGLDSTLVVMTSDHGVLPLVETLQVEGIDARRAHPIVFQDAVDAALNERFERPAGFVVQMRPYGDGIYLNTALIAERGVLRSEVEQTITDALIGTGLVAAVYTHEQLASGEPSGDPYLQLFRNSFFSSRSPHLSIRLDPYVYMSSFPGGTGHGTAYDYDRHVPIVLMGPGVRAGTFPLESGPEDIAPTLAAILGLDYPREPDSRILSEALD